MADDRKTSFAYISYASLKNTIRALTHEGKLPPRIDNSVLTSLNGSTRFQFLGALRFLGLVDDAGKPLSRMTALAASDDAQWKSAIGTLLQEKYPSQLAALKDGTPKSFRESFEIADVGPSIVTPAARFLLSAAEDAGLPISHHIGSRGISGPRATKKKSIKENGTAALTEVEAKVQPGIDTAFRDMLLQKFPEFNPEWDETKQTAWFASFSKFMEMSKGAPPA